ncbi:MAG: carbon storage regulator CsrA [Parcubacteria group bacterium Gr01-1014_38]|nr:MAG: carbon storage regulator CsrA [Parcubacteria group bacterium Gr01-1014_38]
MLVLSRKKGERIVINDNIIVTVVEIRGDRVRLGVAAPPDVTVHRQEVFDAIQEYKQREAVPEPQAEPTGESVSS